MAVQRVEWQCPGCQRKFAIPNQQPRPKLCPECQRSQTPAHPRRPPAGSGSFSAQASLETEPEFADYPAEPPAMLPSPPGQSPRPVKRRRYEELRTLSLVLKILAALIGLLTMILLGEAARALMATEAGDLRRYMVYYCLGILLGGSTAALLVYSFSVLMLVALDVEYNTRQD
jgi:hypothetical protein